MKTTKLIQTFLLLTLFISACKKDENANYLTGVVKHKYTKAPIAGLDIQIKEVRPGFLLGGSTIWDKTTTNSKGEYKLKLQESNTGFEYDVQILRPSTFDASKITFQYMPNRILLPASKLTSQFDIELEPSGYIEIETGSFDSIPADFIVITSPYTAAELIPGNERVNFYVDPSKLNEFSWFSVKDGIKGNTITKQIYVPNYYKSDGNSSLYYKLTF